MSSKYENTPFHLKDRSALVTGGTRGLGKEMARILAPAGAEVAICGRNEGQARTSAADLTKEIGTHVEPHVADVRQRDRRGHFTPQKRN